ncbi:Serine/threonine-protein kinase PrkC [Rosistilla carotiformis]|uniref:Serine/threonine-protein kinase PrkC n=1 Tax=Rosistilla carotiformis TaxID=2528017 RepID=A0A518JU03_9BACT|nr:serine/threonine-protein kinase [Rosistilla carotiformis]QDV69023.1 Serine/threonine-protein kinase PrkC [Rosistilla carotiformis]
MNKTLDLPPLNEQDSVAALIETLKVGLQYPADDGFNDSYCRIRAILRRHPLLKGKLPEFLASSTTLEAYRVWMKQRYEKSFEWNSHVGNALAQLISLLSSGDSLDNYDIERELGRGGFGRIFVARHKLTERRFAIKFYQPMFHDGGGTALSRFFQEASMLYDLQHPNIVTVRDVGLYRERPFIVMDYFESLTLNRALMAYGRMPPVKALSMVKLMTSALQHAHEKQIVHRDLTPGNVLLAPNDCRIIDFGLGVYVERSLTSRLTQQGENPAGGHYTARELIDNPKLIDRRSDIYSIGALWYNAVTNTVPGGANFADSLTEIAELPESHRAIILTCLSDMEHRYQSCEELQSAIQANEEAIE